MATYDDFLAGPDRERTEDEWDEIIDDVLYPGQAAELARLRARGAELVRKLKIGEPLLPDAVA